MRVGDALAAALLAGLGLACARPGTPRGGPEDRRPPVVIEAEPTPLARVDDPAAPIRFRFSERISERPSRGVLDEAVLVSPLTGAVQVDHDSDQLRVFVAGGLRPGLVYRITVLPVLVDLFGNRMTDPFEVVFSTGGELVENAVAGQALDRITGRASADLVVALLPANPVADTVRYLARTDQNGLFFFRYAPAGRYNMVAFEDRNRNLTPDPNETMGRRQLAVAEADTLITDVTVLAPDSTAAQLVRVEVADSTALRLVFTDYLDPEGAERALVSLAAVEDDTIPGAVPQVTRVLHPTAWDALRDSLRGASDSAARDAGAPPSRVPRAGQTLSAPGQERGGLPGDVPLPRQELMAQLDAPLVVGKRYRVSASRVTNVNEIPLGGGGDTIVRPPPPPADSAGAERGPPTPPAEPPDEPGDTLGQPADTSRLGLRPRERTSRPRQRR